MPLGYWPQATTHKCANIYFPNIKTAPAYYLTDNQVKNKFSKCNPKNKGHRAADHFANIPDTPLPIFSSVVDFSSHFLEYLVMNKPCAWSLTAAHGNSTSMNVRHRKKPTADELGDTEVSGPVLTMIVKLQEYAGLQCSLRNVLPFVMKAEDNFWEQGWIEGAMGGVWRT